MKQAIVVGSYRGSPWLEQCLASIPSFFPVLVVRNGGYECGALSWVRDNTTLDRFLFLQDSTRIKDAAWLHECWRTDTSISLNAEPREYGSFMGFYRRAVLDLIPIPHTPDKLQAVEAEVVVSQAYCAIEQPAILWPNFTLQFAVPEAVFQGTVHERLTMRYENEHFVKWKSAWNGESMFAARDRDNRLRQS